MLETSVGSLAMSRYGAAPLEAVQVQDEQLIEPVLAVTTSKHVHLVVDNARSVELPHGRFSPDDAGDVEAQFVHSLLQVDEDHVREHLESIPTTVDDNLAAIPDLTGVPHSRLGKLVFVDLGLAPGSLL